MKWDIWYRTNKPNMKSDETNLFFYSTHIKKSCAIAKFNKLKDKWIAEGKLFLNGEVIKLSILQIHKSIRIPNRDIKSVVRNRTCKLLLTNN